MSGRQPSNTNKAVEINLDVRGQMPAMHTPASLIALVRTAGTLRQHTATS